MVVCEDVFIFGMETREKFFFLQGARLVTRQRGFGVPSNFFLDQVVWMWVCVFVFVFVVGNGFGLLGWGWWLVGRRVVVSSGDRSRRRRSQRGVRVCGNPWNPSPPSWKLKKWGGGERK